MPRFTLAALGAFALSAAPAHAALETTTSLTFNSAGTITDNFRTLYGNVIGSPSAPFLTIYGGPDITPGTTLYAGTTTADFYVDSYFFMGVTPASSGTGQHLVLGVNRDLSGQDFGALFPGYSEAALIDAIVGLNAGTVPNFGAAYQLASGFQTKYQSYAFRLSGTGYLTSFSTGQAFGTITTSSVTQNGPGAVPEVATWLMLIAGLGMIGVVLRRRMPAPALA